MTIRARGDRGQQEGKTLIELSKTQMSTQRLKQHTQAYKVLHQIFCIGIIVITLVTLCGSCL